MLLPEDHRLGGAPQEVERQLRRLTSIGRPLPDVEVRVVDAEGVEVARGEIGEIAVRTPRLMKGYVSQGDATAQTIVDGWLHTRDMGWMDEDGYLYLAGRKDDAIQTYKRALKEVTKLRREPEIRGRLANLGASG